MAKGKHKKYTGNKKHTTAPRSVAPVADAASVVRAAKPMAPQAGGTKPAGVNKSAAPAAKAVDFRTEYRYVLGDLKRIGILAAAMFTTLVVLALVLR